MLEFSSTLSTMLGNATSKSAWSASFIIGLGDNRRLICTKNGTPFIDVALTGAITTAGGNITGFGKASDATVQQAADLSIGTCLLRIEGNSQYVQGTLGLAGSGADFILSANPTASSGVGLGATATIKAPFDLPSGTGPAAPELDANAITAFRLIAYNADETVPIDMGTVQINVREPDMVLDRPYMAQEIGDVRRMRVADGAGLVLGTGGDCYRFAASTLTMNPVVNSEANVPLHQVMIRAKPHGRWASYPFKKDLNTALDTMIPPAHKIELLRADGSIVDVIEMYSTRDANNTPGSGWPVNSKRMSQFPAIGQPYKALWTCAMVHYYESHKPKMHSLAQHFLPPIVDDGIFHPRNVAEFASSPQHWPLITGSQTYAGLGAWRVSPKWSRPYNAGCDTTIIDTGWAQIARDDYTTQLIGYGFEPAATGHHTWYNAPGGPRHDRGPWPTPIITWVTNPNGIRVHGAVPNREMVSHWFKNYFNVGLHYFTDLERGLGIPKSKVLNGEICFNDTYYRGGNEDFRPDLDNNAVRILATPRQENDSPLDKNGRRFTNDYARDYLHSNSNAASGAYLACSAAHVLGATHSFIGHVLCAFDLTQTFARSNFLTRQHAWFEKAFAEMWVVASNAPDGFSSNEIESMWGRHLERVYDNVYPAYASGTDIYSVCLRNLGMGAEGATDGASTQIVFWSDSKAGYFGQVLMFMKQTGSWDVMRARSPKCAAALDMIVDCMTKFTTGPFVDANGVGIDKYGYIHQPTIPTEALQTYSALNDALSDWGKLFPPDGQMNWIRGRDGVINSTLDTYGTDGTNTMHYRAQTLKILKTFDYASGARIDTADSKVNGWYAEVAAGVAAGTNDQFGGRFLMMGFHATPDYVGPPA